MSPRSWLQHRPALGLVIDQQQVALSVVATTPRGRREVARDFREYDGDALPAAVHDLLRPYLPPSHSRRLGPWVQVALAESRVFQSAMAITAANRLSSPQNFFLEAVQSTNLRAEDRVIDLIRLEVGKQPLACLAACPRALVAALAEMFERMGARLAVLEPSPAGLVRAAALAAPPSRGGHMDMRFVLGRRRAIGIVAVGVQPLYWHGFDLAPGDEAASILAAHSTLWMLGRHSKITAPVDRVFVHGRPDLELAIDPEKFRKRTGSRLVRLPRPDHDHASAAAGVALNNPLTEPGGHNLAREYRPPIPVRDIFPWAEVLLQGTMVAGVSLFLRAAAEDVDTKYRTARAEATAFAWLKDQDQAKLDAEKKLLEERLRTLESFRQSRMDWSAQIRTIAGDTPDTTVINSLVGDNETEAASRPGLARGKKQLIVNFSTPLGEDGSMPGEIDRFISELRAEATILAHFANIEVTGLKTGSLNNDKASVAQYSVVCLPKVETTGKAKPR